MKKKATLKNIIGTYYQQKDSFLSLISENGKIVSAYVNRLKQFNQLGQKNYQLIVESLNAGILFQDKKGELIAVNQKAAEIFNALLERLYQLANIVNLWKTAWQITTENGNSVPIENTPFMKVLQTGQPQTEVLVVRLRNGEHRWLHFSSHPLSDDNNAKAYSVVSNIVELTEERRLSTRFISV